MNRLLGKRVIVYRRVSTKEQKEFGYSLLNQYETISNFIKHNSMVLIKDFEEDFSAKDFDRPVFTEMLKYIKNNHKNIDMLLVHRWDRFSRNLHESLNMISKIKKLGIEINATSQWTDHDDVNSYVSLVLNLTMPEVDNKQKGQNIRDANRRTLKEGRYVYSAPKGYYFQKDELGKKIITPKPITSELIKDLFHDFSLGIYSQNQLRKQKKYSELRLSKSTISRILQNILYTGYIMIPEYKTETELIIKGQHKPII